MFKSALRREIRQSRGNNFGIENYDEDRFGKMPELATRTEPLHRASMQKGNLLHSLKQLIKKTIRYEKIREKKSRNTHLQNSLRELEKYGEGLEYLYKNVNSESKNLIVKIIAYRLLGFSKVKIPFNNEAYWNSLELAKTLKDGSEQYDSHFRHFILEKFDLAPIGFNVRLFFTVVGIAIDFVAEQYAYKTHDRTIVQAEEGDVVLDVGGCWGDTALYFAAKVGGSGKVFSFEFIPDNIKLHNINTALNPELKTRIELIPFPVSDVSGVTVYFKDNGPASRVEYSPFEHQSGFTTTLSIDDFVNRNNISKIDFIKMDIEGAEPMALKGAVETIKKFRPKLAIAIYHSMDDFVNIPKWILDLNLGYELFVGHYTIHAEETVCFAQIKK